MTRVQDRGFCFDVDRHNRTTGVRHIGAYWALLAGLLDDDRGHRLIEHLADETGFKRRHFPSALAADHPAFRPEGGYWRGAVWPPTTWMVLKGLERYGRHDLAHEMAVNHHEAMLQVWRDTGTVWENYAPDAIEPGAPAKRNFVGWGGLAPIAVLLEHRFGLRPDVATNRLVWEVRLRKKHGVRRYPFGPGLLLDLRCEARAADTDEPEVTASGTGPVAIEVRWPGGSKALTSK